MDEEEWGALRRRCRKIRESTCWFPDFERWKTEDNVFCKESREWNVMHLTYLISYQA